MACTGIALKLAIEVYHRILYGYSIYIKIDIFIPNHLTKNSSCFLGKYFMGSSSKDEYKGMDHFGETPANEENIAYPDQHSFIK